MTKEQRNFTWRQCAMTSDAETQVCLPPALHTHTHMHIHTHSRTHTDMHTHKHACTHMHTHALTPWARQKLAPVKEPYTSLWKHMAGLVDLLSEGLQTPLCPIRQTSVPGTWRPCAPGGRVKAHRCGQV